MAVVSLNVDNIEFSKRDPRSKDYFEVFRAQGKSERTSFDPHWKECSEFFQPRRGRFTISDRNKGGKRWQSVINNAATMALRNATAGMFAGTMNPARPWFEYETDDLTLMKREDVKEWIWFVQELIRRIFNDSNLYVMVPTMIKELLLFGTGFMQHVDDFKDVARFYSETAGSYMLFQNGRLQIDMFIREFEWTVKQIVETFGEPRAGEHEGRNQNISSQVWNAYNKGNYSSWYPVVHCVLPNPRFDPRLRFSEAKKFLSVYYEPGHGGQGTNVTTNETRNQFLSRGGFDQFPAYTPRWEVTGADIYATEWPAATALGDTKQMQVQEKRKGQAIDKMVWPLMAGPPSLRNVPVERLPGGLTTYEGGDQRNQLRAVYQIDPRIQEMRFDIAEVTRRIETAFFIDLFLAISNMQGIQPKNELDILSRNEERLLMLGPVLQRLQMEFQGALVNRTFDQCVNADILPPAPEVLQGQNLNLKFTGTLAMAQRAVATSDIDRLTAYASQVVTVPGWERAKDKFDPDAAIEEYGRALGAPPKVVRPDDQVAQIREREDQERAAAMALEGAQGLASTAKMAAEADATAGEKA